MTCTRIDLGNGDFMITCYRGQRRPKATPCSVCHSRESTQLCDFRLRGSETGKTCDRKLCKTCAVKHGDIDLCPPHAKHTAAQSTLPLGKEVT
jgi:hypothetical protein